MKTAKNLCLTVTGLSTLTVSCKKESASTLLDFQLFFSGLNSTKLASVNRTNGSIAIDISIHSKLIEHLRNYQEEELHHR